MKTHCLTSAVCQDMKEGKKQTHRKEIFQFLDDMNRAMCNAQTYDFGTLKTIQEEPLAQQVRDEKTTGFDSLNNLELEAFRTLQKLQN